MLDSELWTFLARYTHLFTICCKFRIRVALSFTVSIETAQMLTTARYTAMLNTRLSSQRTDSFLQSRLKATFLINQIRLNDKDTLAKKCRLHRWGKERGEMGLWNQRSCSVVISTRGGQAHPLHMSRLQICLTCVCHLLPHLP